MRRLAVALAFTALSVAAALSQSRTEVRFEPGADSARVSGTLTGHGHADYLLDAAAGQTMQVTIHTDGTAFFNILPPGSDSAAIFIGAMAPGPEGSVRLPSDGAYTIRVYLMGNDRDTDYFKMMKIVIDAGYRGYVGIEYSGGDPAPEKGIAMTRDLLRRVRDKLSAS